jgi:Holliday junction resolvase RusA-like endonuclease
MNLHLPNPPSPNSIWKPGLRKTKASGVRSVMVRTAEYEAWLQRAGYILNRQAPKPVKGPVFVQIRAQENKRRDLDGFIKAPLDLLVTHKLIDGDNGTTVRGIAVEWTDDIEGIEVRITSMQIIGGPKE